MKSRITEILGIEKPIIQAPMNWLTDGKFVGAISKAGALGVIGINAGQTEQAQSVEETIENLRREVRIAKEITSNPIGMNVVTSVSGFDAYTQPMLDLMVEENVEVAIMVGAFSKEWTQKFKEKGIKVVYRGEPTPEITEEAIQGGVDIIVATGFDEGGQVPTKVIGTFSIVPLLVDVAKGRVPVMAARGITDERTAHAAMALGAEGIFVGTGFLTAEESRMADNIKQAVIDSNAHDMLLYRTLPAYYRSLPGELPNKLVQMDREHATNEDIFKASRQGSGMRDGMIFGDLTKGYASVGLGISMIHKVEPAADIVDRLMTGIMKGEN
ncbi:MULTISPECIES: nitronate monooxygenase [unclassified Staphylococcus]|uniref:NAD(P)H-dependent flavin oxidoreductase n=1 Tax=unclassified Staphylococcus TaxID=91994 RepID=UPI0021D16A25|nr:MULTISPECIES: nitronate monooxygenase [unclassified Staphylococcus]UXR75579.1 nitronate monooxygenase [Staphylococcus sp. IVB6233]UXR79780.1 nitronate monooxygenase [Staphylococcus sp. IVB6218]